MPQVDSLKSLFQYLEGMKSFYGWSAEEWDDVNNSFQSLVQRNNDKSLYMGIVGEFSAGKSTFINALLGAELLKEDILPGTTCATTLIRYGKSFEVEIHRNDTPAVLYYTKTKSLLSRASAFILRKLNINVRLQKQLEEAKAFIFKYTADEDMAQNVSSVTIYLPYKATIFENDVVIVDTPGINADNLRHQEVTENTIRDLCDLAIVLTPAPTPCSQTLISFLHEHAESFNDYCICLASQIDRIRPKERKRQLKYISDRFQSEGVVFSKISSVSAYCAIHEDSSIGAEDAKQLRDEFSSTVSVICEELRHNRNIILSTKLQQILGHIVNDILVPKLKNTSSEFQERYETLQRNQLSDFDAFLQRGMQKAIDSFSRGYVKKHEVDDIVSSAKEQFVDRLTHAISVASSKSDLKAIMTQEHIGREMASIQNSYINNEIANIQHRFLKSAESLLENFKSNFNNEFRNLARHVEIEASTGEIHISGLNVVTNESVGAVSASIANEGWAKLGAATVGAGIGTWICPGLGTIIGAGIGGLIGALFGKSLDEHKSDARDLVNSVADQWAGGLSDQILTTVLQPNFQAVENNLVDSIYKFSMFKNTVENIIKEEKAQQEKMKGVIKQAQGDISLFQNMLKNPNYLYNNN